MTIEDIVVLALVGVAGGWGSVIRYRLMNRPSNWLPWGTLLANTIATMLGAVAFLNPDIQGALPDFIGGMFNPATAAASILVVGFAGGLSTFSTVAGQVSELLKARLWLRAVVYGLGSFVIPSTAAALLVGILM